MLRSIHEEILNKPWPRASYDRSSEQTAIRRRAMLAVLERFAIGHRMVIRADMKELGTMMRHEPFRGWWEFRSQGPMTETRLFGFFARPGAFVAMDFKPRDLFGDRQDPEWDLEHKVCLDRWNNLTGDAPYLDVPWPVDLRSQLLLYTDGMSDDP
jgi:hypothetical protein